MIKTRSLAVVSLGILMLTTGVVFNPAFSDVIRPSGDCYVDIEFLKHTDETDGDIERVRTTLSHIPEDVQKKVASKGIKIVLTPSLIYDEPETSGSTIFRNGGTVDNVGGMFEGGKHRVILPERAAWGRSPLHPQGDGLKGILRHEFGHAWDNACGGLSRSDDFKAAYDADVSRFSNTEMRQWAYSVTGVSKSDANVPTDSGRAECLAIAFDHLLGPIGKRDKDGFTKSFSHVVSFLQSYEPSLKNANWQPPVDPKKVEQPLKASNPEVASPAQAQIDAAIALLNQQRWQDAIKLLDQAIKLDPGCKKAYGLKGNAECWLKQYRQAIADYSTFIKLAPDDPEGYTLRARAYGWLGQVNEQSRNELAAKRRMNNVKKSSER